MIRDLARNPLQSVGPGRIAEPTRSKFAPGLHRYPPEPIRVQGCRWFEEDAPDHRCPHPVTWYNGSTGMGYCECHGMILHTRKHAERTQEIKARWEKQGVRDGHALAIRVLMEGGRSDVELADMRWTAREVCRVAMEEVGCCLESHCGSGSSSGTAACG